MKMTRHLCIQNGCVNEVANRGDKCGECSIGECSKCHSTAFLVRAFKYKSSSSVEIESRGWRCTVCNTYMEDVKNNR